MNIVWHWFLLTNATNIISSLIRSDLRLNCQLNQHCWSIFCVEEKTNIPVLSHISHPITTRASFSGKYVICKRSFNDRWKMKSKLSTIPVTTDNSYCWGKGRWSVSKLLSLNLFTSRGNELMANCKPLLLNKAKGKLKSWATERKREERIWSPKPHYSSESAPFN